MAPEQSGPAAPSRARREELARQYYQLVDAEDFPAMHDLFTDDCVYERPGYDPLRGRAQMESFYSGTRVIASGAHRIDELLVDGDRVAVHGVFTGTLRDGSASEVGFADFFTYAGDKIAHRRSFFFRPAV